MGSKINTMHNWIKRRSAVHKNWTADELWNRIRTNWPTLSESDAETIFQECAYADRR